MLIRKRVAVARGLSGAFAYRLLRGSLHSLRERSVVVGPAGLEPATRPL
jgi:hypothetical protein